MKVKDYLETFHLENENPFDNKVLLKYINAVEQNLDIVKDYRTQTYDMVKDRSQYELPEGVSFDDVYCLRVNGRLYKKVDVREYQKFYTFWFEGGKLNIYPACSKNKEGGIKLVYKYRPIIKHIENIETDDLYLPDRWIEIYDYYLLSKLAYNRKEFGEAQNHIAMYNAAVANYAEWWENNRPSNPEEEFTPQDDYYEPIGFDYE